MPWIGSRGRWSSVGTIPAGTVGKLNLAATGWPLAAAARGRLSLENRGHRE